jgi:hypothetical protein
VCWCRLANDCSNAFSGAALQAGSTPDFALNKNQRRSERVFLILPIRISGVGEQGRDFFVEGRTVDVSQHGATVVVDRELFVGQSIKVQRIGHAKEGMARVVSHKASQSEGHLFGIAFTDERANLWDIVFPNVAELEKPVLRTLLRCISCGQLEVSYLNEFESMLFLTHHSVARLCGQCGGWTTWTRPYGSALVGSGDVAESGAQDSGGRNQHHRSYERLRTETVGCIRNSASGNEVVRVSNLARGGLSFHSASFYSEGDRVEIAIPYTSKTPNIYLPARIVGSRKGRDKGLTEYSAAYLA